jgi:tRNA U55 pseudouridine synthase TruB
VAEEELLKARDTLTGEIQQLPPMYSAIKVGLEQFAVPVNWT